MKRAATLFARNFHSRAFVRLVKFNGCCQECGVRASESHPLECSHAETRGMGGCGADWRRIFRACKTCHQSYEQWRHLYFHAATVEGWITDLQREAREAGVIE